MRLPRSSGVLLHPTCLPGPHGSGDLGAAARHFVDWLVTAGQQHWQVLPLGDTGGDISPYMGTSSAAGNVLLIDLDDLHHRGWLAAEDLVPAAGLEATRLNIAAVRPWRMERLARAAHAFDAKGSAADRADFDDFCDAHRSWLADYALFMTLVEHHGGRDWCGWDAALAAREPAALAAAARSQAPRVAFWQFCQWRFFRQWAGLRAYARERGVGIIGDVPIFVAHQSAEVWLRPDLFELDAQGRPTVVAGVPPDAFSATGQRWGNPLYRWAAHARDGYAWWTERIRRSIAMVDLLRIDHFRGFAGHWEIPAAEPTAVHGRWVPGPGTALFDAVTQVLGPLPMLAEDLGIITPDVVAMRKKLAFPGMCVLQFAWGNGSGNPYLPHNHRPDTVVYSGTHDNNTSPGWWADATDAEQRHLRDYLGTDGREIHWDLIRAACASVADLALYPMQDVLGLGAPHRMNFPGHLEGCWQWRLAWEQLQPEHAQRLRHLCELYRRDGTPLQSP